MLARRELFLKRAVLLVAVVVGVVTAAEVLTGEEPSGTEIKLRNALSSAENHVEHAVYETIDPVEQNGEIFVDWPTPDVVLLFSGEMDGYLEPCGCAGLENQKGGLKRRSTLVTQLRDKGWPVVALDNGGMIKRFGSQAEIKHRYGLEALAEIDYSAVGLGSHDLSMDLLSVVINLDDEQNRLVSANVGLLGFDSGFTKRFTVVEAGGMKIGVTAVLGKAEAARFAESDELDVLDPQAALGEVIPELRKADCDQLVLLAYAGTEEASALAAQYPEFDWVVSAKGADEPPIAAAPIEGSGAQLIEVGHKAMYVVVIGLYKEGPVHFRYQRVPLDARFIDSPAIHELLSEYQDELETLGLEGLGLRPSMHPSGRKFAGSAVCADCHLEATEVFESTTHAHATDTLVALDPPRQYDPECLSCHVTGWEPQKYFPFISGYLSMKETPEMVGNGCENCHGPAARHAAAEYGDIDATDEELEQFRTALRLTVVENEGNQDSQVFGEVAQMCMQCHDLDNSPEFDFQHYWPEVAHEGKD